MDDQSGLKMAFLSVSKIANITIAKKIAFLMVTVLVVYKGIQHIHSDPCERLCAGGSFIDKTKWQPDGCMFHTYKKSESQKCLRNLKIVFIGDSRIRQLYFFFVDKVANFFERPEIRHSSYVFQKEDLDIRFYWMPELTKPAIDLYNDLIKENSPPDFLVQSAAAHSIKRLNGSKQALREYEKNLTTLIDKMQRMFKTQIYWILQDPVVERRLNTARQAITNEQLAAYNHIALKLFEDMDGQSLYPNIDVLKSLTEVAKQTIHSLRDGLHVGNNTLVFQFQILLNLFCNEQLQPEFGLCCQKSPAVNTTQKFLFAFACLCVFLSLLVNFWFKVENDKQNNVEFGISKSMPVSNFKEAFNAAGMMALLLLYFYICDRTNIFMRSNKHYTHFRFFIPLLYIILLGIFGIDQAKSPDILNRNQTDEWKGWMQLLILLYHMTGASQNVSIYMHVRILVAMYLFMTGYGHFSYFWQKKDLSFYRVFNVLFRLNFLTVLLCLVMNRSYQFYYYVPLCSFWFIMLYLFMLFWPQVFSYQLEKSSFDESSKKNWQSHYSTLLMACKLFIFFLFICILFYSERFFQSLFSWWPVIKFFELPTGSLHEWWFRCQLDRFSVLHGVVFCFVHLLLKRFMNDDSKQGCLFSTKYSFIVVCSAIITIMFYSNWAAHCTNKVECNKHHSYFSFLPVSCVMHLLITAFILIRNIPGYLRSNYSCFFAWFGKISLELFIGQYHIWLAADTRGVLVLTSPSWPTVDLVLVTFIFVCVAHEINRITGVLAQFVVGSPKNGDQVAWIRFLVVIAVILAISFPTSFLS